MKSAVCVLFLTGLKKVKRRKKANSAKKISVCQQIFNILVTWVGIQTKDSIWKMLTQNWNNFSPKLVSPSLSTYLFTTRFPICIMYQNIVKWNESISRNFWWLFCFFWEIFLGKDYCPNQVFVYFFPGVSERELQDKDTRDFIYDFIDRHGGIEAALEEVENRNRTPAPAPPPRQSSIARPPPPSKVCSIQKFWF